MQLYDITIAANTTRQLDAPGSYFYYYAGSAGGADSTITLRGISSGLRLILKPGQAFRLPDGNIETSWILTNYANTATIVGTVLVGDGDITDNRITGSVEVVDGNKNRVTAGNGFAWRPTSIAATNKAHAQLWNPSGSGKNLIIDGIIITSTVAGGITIGTYNTQLSTAAPSQVNNILSASAATSVATPLVQEIAGVSFTRVFGTLNVAANTSQAFDLKRPIVIQPNTGLIIISEANASTISGTVQFFEESAT